MSTAVAVGLASGAIAWYLKPAPPTTTSPAGVTRFVLLADVSLPADRVGVLAPSPDGRHLVFVATSGNHRSLYLRDLDRLEAAAIPDTDGADLAAYSPDGKWIAFEADGQIKKVALTGGICDTWWSSARGTSGSTTSRGTREAG